MKSTAALKNVVVPAVMAFDGKTPLIAVGPLTKQPSSCWYRIVMADKGDKLVVWSETVPKYPSGEGSSFSSGTYFKPDQMSDANEAFANRVARQTSMIGSIYRDLPEDGAIPEAKLLDEAAMLAEYKRQADHIWSQYGFQLQHNINVEGCNGWEVVPANGCVRVSRKVFYHPFHGFYGEASECGVFTIVFTNDVYAVEWQPAEE